MPTIYLDNFRGFHNSFIPLKNVNFLVGENSTGKSSLLSILKFIARPDFTFDPKFNDEEIELGYYSDISNPLKQKYFDIAVIPPGSPKISQKSIVASMMRFIEVDSKPKLSKYRYLTNNLDIRMSFDSDTDVKITYRSLSSEARLNKRVRKYEFFKKWVREFNFKGENITIELNRGPLGLPIIFRVMIELQERLKLKGPGISFIAPFEKYFTWIGPIRAKPKRIYEQFKDKHTPEGEHFPIVLKRLLDRRDTKLLEVNRAIEKFGKASGLYTRIKTKPLGKELTAPFTIIIEIDNKKHKIFNVGYGVSQILPLIVEIVSTDQEGWMSIQQPEVHLHPKAQAAFGDVILTAYLNKRINFLVETHSEYTVDRFRMSYSKKKGKTGTAQVLFFEKTKYGNKVRPIIIGKDGSYVGKLPKAFKEFFIAEEIKLLEL